jgi:hypothetical protein
MHFSPLLCTCFTHHLLDLMTFNYLLLSRSWSSPSSQVIISKTPAHLCRLLTTVRNNESLAQRCSSFRSDTFACSYLFLVHAARQLSDWFVGYLVTFYQLGANYFQWVIMNKWRKIDWWMTVETQHRGNGRASRCTIQVTNALVRSRNWILLK